MSCPKCGGGKIETTYKAKRWLRKDRPDVHYMLSYFAVCQYNCDDICPEGEHLHAECSCGYRRPELCADDNREEISR